MSKILLVGAGASYGHGVKRVMKPPMASGFFTHPAYLEIADDYGSLVEYIKHVLLIDLSNPIESDVEYILGRMEPTWRMHLYDDLQTDEINRLLGEPFGYVSPIDMMRSLIVDILLVSTSWLTKQTCPYHRFLAMEWLDDGDCIISFNYDLIIDLALRERGNWNSLDLLKLHGSLNWYRSHGDRYRDVADNSADDDDQITVVDLDPFLPTIDELNPAKVMNGFMLRHKREELVGIPPKIGPKLEKSLHADKDSIDSWRYTYRYSPGKLNEHGDVPLIILPSPNKAYDEMSFAELQSYWRRARSHLKLCNEVLAIGFSFRDLHFNQLLREAALARDTPLILKIATKNQSVVDATQREFERANIRTEYINAHLDELVTNLGYQDR